ncbi:hypothetical protein [Ancylobacter vacuolatus]|uniref:Uncharacterized protein n=1 Tax=Ancylobacter vacuolatus TaxID=223389 RepID=A0ABU0DN44_9HYPH|nr:hypothetical protein [Ancylobacter vacuolatus]MDQ0349721.1 hypothetical protein [Ancylobacter vacuolatus]
MTFLVGLLSFFTGPIGRYVLIALLAAGAVSGIYLKGRSEGRAACIAEGEKDVLRTIERADDARAAADRRNADDGRLRDDDTFRRD